MRSWTPAPRAKALVTIPVEVLDLPFSLYFTFVVEERHGFNRTTPATFVKDLAKGCPPGANTAQPKECVG